MPTEVTKLSAEQIDRMTTELAHLRLRAEHGLLRRLVERTETPNLSAADLAASMQALAALSPR